MAQVSLISTGKCEICGKNLGPSDRVIIASENTPEYIRTIYFCGRVCSNKWLEIQGGKHAT
jgi:hypothetical protein